VLLAACASPDLPKPQVWRHQVTVAAEHSGSSIELGRDQELVVRLATPSNTPFEWSLVDLPRGVLAAPDAAKFEREPRATNFDDAAGAEVWRFRAAAAGSVTLRFEFRRAHSLDPATQTVTYTVTVR
jgi:predicted secreted protein